MLETQKPNTMHWASENDKNFIAELISGKKNKRLIWDGYLPNGKKKQYWENKDIDWELHLTGQLKQGGNLCFEIDGKKYAKAAVVDVDQKVDAKEICSEVFSLDPKAVPIKSPSGRWHIWMFFSKPVAVTVAAKWSRDLGMKLAKKKYTIDFGKCNPNHNGSDVGINYPFHSKQIPYDPRGKPYTSKQFKHRIRFNNYSYIAAATNLETGKNRYDALLFGASILHAAGQYKDEYIDAIVENFGTPFDDHKKIQKIKDGQYKDYKLSPETIKRKIGEMIDKDLAAEMDLELAPVAEQLEALELEEYTGTETLKARHWIVDGWMMKKALTLIVGQAGVGKTILMAMLAAALANGQKILGRPIKENGNVLILAAEETKNEIRLRIKAIENLLEHKKTNNKIFIRGLEDQIKLVKFTMAEAKATKEYLQLQLAIKKHNIKFILLDPLISFQTGAYDENNNAKMEQFVKDFLIPLAVENNGCIVAGHHTNKFSMITITDGELLVDHQVALNAARGASSLVAAARFVLAIQPMTKKLFKDKFQDHIKDGSKFTNYAGLIEAKSNYSITEDEIDWLKKNSVSLEVVNEDGESANESLGVFTTSDINKIAKAKNKLKAEKNEAFAKSQIPLIKSLMVNDECTLNAAVEQVVMKDPEFADTNVDEKTIKSRVRRQLVNGLNGSAETKNGMTAQGISYDDGYNYWVKVDNSRDGAAKYFIQRGKDFSK